MLLICVLISIALLPAIALADELYIFISLTMPRDALIALAGDAKKYHATLVLRGLKDNSFKATQDKLRQLNLLDAATSIDPQLFTSYNIQAVPSFVLTTISPNHSPIYDKLTGNVTSKYALEHFAKHGDLAVTAQQLLGVK